MSELTEKMGIWLETDWVDGDFASEVAADIMPQAKARIEELEAHNADLTKRLGDIGAANIKQHRRITELEDLIKSQDKLLAFHAAYSPEPDDHECRTCGEYTHKNYVCPCGTDNSLDVDTGDD